MSTRVIINGNEFKSISAAARAYGVDEQFAHRQIRKGVNLEDLLITNRTEPLKEQKTKAKKQKEKKKCFNRNEVLFQKINGRYVFAVDGVLYKSATELAEAYDVKPWTLRKYLKNGLSVEDALAKSAERKVIVNGTEYSSLKEAVDALGVNKSAVETRIKNGMTVDEAIACVRNEDCCTTKNDKGTLVKVNRTFANREEVLEYLKQHPYDKNQPINVRIAHLCAARDAGDKTLMNEIVNDIMFGPCVMSQVAGIVKNKYGKYGVNELRYIYDTTTFEAAKRYVFTKLRDEWLDHCNWKFAERYLYSQIESFRVKKVITSFCTRRIHGLYTDWLFDMIAPDFPSLKRYHLVEYVRFRKTTGYGFTLENSSDEALIRICQQHDLPMTKSHIETMRRAFGYSADEAPSEFRRLCEQPLFKKNHPDEAAWLKKTEADLITEDEAKVVLRKIQYFLDYTDADIAVLRNWLYRCRYEGNPSDEGIKVTATLCDRYKSNDSAKVLSSMRADVRDTLTTDYSPEKRVMDIICATDATSAVHADVSGKNSAEAENFALAGKMRAISA